MPIRRPEGPLEYEAYCSWNGRTGGRVKLQSGVEYDVDMSEEFGGAGEAPSPDEFFIASVSGCILTTALWFAEKLGVKLSELAVRAKSRVELVGGGFQITKLWITLRIAGPSRETCEKLAELAERYCHLARTLRDCVDIEFTVEISKS